MSYVLSRVFAGTVSVFDCVYSLVIGCGSAAAAYPRPGTQRKIPKMAPKNGTQNRRLFWSNYDI